MTKPEDWPKSEDFVTDVDWPDDQIKHTVGIWVRSNTKDDTIEIWFDGQFVAAWHDRDKIIERLTTMCRKSCEVGIAEGKRQVREALGIQ